MPRPAVLVDASVPFGWQLPAVAVALRCAPVVSAHVHAMMSASFATLPHSPLALVRLLAFWVFVLPWHARIVPSLIVPCGIRVVAVRFFFSLAGMHDHFRLSCPLARPQRRAPQVAARFLS